MPEEKVIKHCGYCDKEFEPKNPKGVYCSATCRVYAGRKKGAENKNSIAPANEDAPVPMPFIEQMAEPNILDPDKPFIEIFKEVLEKQVYDGERINYVYEDEAPKVQDTSKVRAPKKSLNKSIQEKVKDAPPGKLRDLMDKAMKTKGMPVLSKNYKKPIAAGKKREPILFDVMLERISKGIKKQDVEGFRKEIAAAVLTPAQKSALIDRIKFF